MLTQRNELNFTGQNIDAGIDVHSKSWNVTIIIAGKYRTLWGLLLQLAGDRLTSWDLPLQIAGSRPTSWDLPPQIAGSFLTSWDLALQIAGDFPTSWDLSLQVATEKTMSWDGLSQPRDSQKTYHGNLTAPLRWHLERETQDSKLFAFVFSPPFGEINPANDLK